MTKLTLLCDAAPCDNVDFRKVGGLVYIEVKMDIETDQPVILLDKSSVAKLVEFLNGLELEE